MDTIWQCMQKDRFAARNDITLVHVEPGRSRAKLALQPHHCNGLGMAHGGAVFTLADFAFAAAANSHGTIAVAVNTSITFIKAAAGPYLWAEAREVSKNFKLGTYTVEVKDEAGELVALFQGLAYRKKDPLPVS